MSDHRQNAIDSLVADMISMYPEDSLIKEAKEELRARDPRLVEQIRPFDPHSRQNLFDYVEPLRDKSPFTPEDLLRTEPANIIRQILDFKETRWGEINRDGLISAVCSAAGQNTDWAFKFLGALIGQGEKDNDFWHRLLWKLKWEKMSVEQRNWLLDAFDLSATYSEDFLAAYTQLVISHGIAPDETPDTTVLKKQLSLTFVLWKRTSGRPGWKIERPYSQNDWIFEAINRPPGHCCLFWLKYTELLQKASPDVERTWPSEIESVMNEIVKGETRGQILALALLGQYLNAIRYMAPEWTKNRLYPCFDFNQRGDKAFPPWLGFSGYGWLSRELARELPPYFVTAFPRVTEFNENIADRFCGLVAAVAISGHWNVKENDWLKNFMISADEKLRRTWLAQLARLLKGSLPEDKENVWKSWLREYWMKRLEGIPEKIIASETQSFYKLALALGPLAHEAVPLLKRLPKTNVDWDHVFFDFEKNPLFKEDPAGLVAIIAWWLPNVRNLAAGPKEIVGFVERLPNSRDLKPELKTIDDELTRMRPDYAQAFRKAVSEKFSHL
jgi:hypothetical protein